MDWQEDYKRKLVSPEEAVKVVKSGDRVVLPATGEPPALGLALAARKNDLTNVLVYTAALVTDYGWYDHGWEDSFTVTLDAYYGPLARPAMAERRADFSPRLYSLHFKPEDERRPGIRETDVYMVVVSPPNQHGYCSFGSSLWYKKSFAKRAKKVLAEVNSNMIRTYGDNFIHVSEIDHFVEYTPEPRPYIIPEFDPAAKSIAQHVNTLIRNGDTIQVGLGTTGGGMALCGAFDNKEDLGLHSELTIAGLVKLIRQGVFTGRRKTLHTGKAIATSFSGDAEDMAFVDGNPMFELYECEYVHSIKTIAAHDNMVAINNAIGVDLTGQIASESLGPRMWSGHGGQPEFAMGAVLSRGGRSITVLPSTASGGTVSRIVPALEPGTIVTIPRTFADYIVTEYGVASLLGKSQRERAEELTAIAHPDFRSELKKEAGKLFYP